MSLGLPTWIKYFGFIKLKGPYFVRDSCALERWDKHDTTDVEV